MVLVISAQPATSNEERLAVLFSCFRDGSLLMEAKDGKKPAPGQGAGVFMCSEGAHSLKKGKAAAAERADFAGDF